MATRIFPLLFFALIFNWCSARPGSDYPAATAYDAIIMFPSTPNPTEGKCLIRTYFSEADPNSSIRILDKDSVLIKEIPLAAEVGIGSIALNVADWKAGTYLYQLFYKGEARSTLSFVVKH